MMKIMYRDSMPADRFGNGTGENCYYANPIGENAVARDSVTSPASKSQVACMRVPELLMLDAATTIQAWEVISTLFSRLFKRTKSSLRYAKAYSPTLTTRILEPFSPSYPESKQIP